MNQPAHIRKTISQLLKQTLESYALFPIFTLLFLAVIWTGTYILITTEGQAIENGAQEASIKLSETYEAQMIRNLGNIDQALKIVKYAYELEMEPDTLHKLVDSNLLPSTLIFTFSVVDQYGSIIAATGPRQQNNIADTPFFQFHQSDNTDSVKLSFKPMPSGRKHIRFSRRIDGPDGSFMGIVMVSLDPQYFTSVYEESNLGQNGVLGLIGTDGKFVVKRTGDKVTQGESAGDLEGAYAENAERYYSALTVNAWDDETRYTNVLPLYGFPLSVIVGLSRDDKLSSFDQQKRLYLGAAMAASLLALVIATLLTRFSWQLAQNRLRTRKEQETYSAASEASLDAIFVLRSELNAQGGISDFVLENVNRRGASMLGAAKQELLRKRLSEVMPDYKHNRIYGDLVNVVQTGIRHEFEFQNDIAAINDGKWLYRQIAPVQDGVVLILRDITERKEAEERISHMAHHDALTGLPNRTLLHDRIGQAILHAQRNEQCVAVAFMDLDKFKQINDGLGHKAGDDLLKTVADRMRQCLRKSDTVVRLGGDEFVIVMTGTSQDRECIIPVVQKIREAISEPIVLAGQETVVTTSMGLAIYPYDGTDTETLLANADAAMYHAKAKGRDNYQFFSLGGD